MTPALIYIAGPYRAASAWLVEQNIRRAEALAYQVATLGGYPVCPHSNTRGYFESANADAFWLAGTLELMRRCGAVLFAPDWELSSGARGEHAEAVRLSLPVFYTLDELRLWLTARESGRQVAHG